MYLKRSAILFFVFCICLLGCQKELSVETNGAGTPSGVLSDTSTLLKLVITNYNSNSVPTDSTLRVIKNAYYNGQKRIIITESDLPSSTDTTYTIFKYDAQGQLIQIVDSANVGSSDTYKENIYWQNNKAVKIVSDSAGIVYRTDDINYLASGTNTKINVTHTPSFDYIGYFPNGTLNYAVSAKEILTVDNSFAPIYKTTYEYHYIDNGNGANYIERLYDTATLVFDFDGSQNIKGQHVYDTNTDTIPVNGIYVTKDTATYTFSRNAAEIPTLYNLFKEIYGDNLLLLTNHLNINFDWKGIAGIYYYSGPFDFPFYKTTVNTEAYSAVSWVNGVINVNPSPVFNQIIYLADNIFDNQSKLIKSTMHDQLSTHTFGSIRLIYP